MSFKKTATSAFEKKREEGLDTSQVIFRVTMSRLVISFVVLTRWVVINYWLLDDAQKKHSSLYRNLSHIHIRAQRYNTNMDKWNDQLEAFFKVSRVIFSLREEEKYLTV